MNSYSVETVEFEAECPELLERMRRILGHRLLNIASGVKAATGFLAGQLDDRLVARERDYFPLIQRQCDEVCTIVERMNLLLREQAMPEPLPLTQVLNCVLSRIRAEFPDVDLSCNMAAPDCMKSICPLTVETALREMVQNARDAASRTVEIDVVLQDHDEMCVFRVIDQGEGFSDESIQSAFEMFYTTRARSIGLGLSIVRKLVCRQGGRISLGKEDCGSYVEFAVPIR